MKACFKCGVEKPLSEYYKHSRMADGHLNKCKTCTKSDVLKHREDNIEKVRAYDRERGKNPARIAATVATVRAWRNEDSRRVAAHSAVARAIRQGSLLRSACERCGNEKSVAHHDDYDKPLSITWLCQPCHKQRHKELGGDF